MTTGSPALDPSTPGATARTAIPAQEIHAEQLQHLAERSLTSARTGLIGVAAVVVSQAQSVAWSALAVFALLRLVNIWYHHVECRKVLKLGGAAALRGGSLARLEWGLFASGCTWGLAAWLLPDHIGADPAAHFLVLLLVAVSSVMLNTTSLTRRAVIFFVGGLWGMLVLRTLWLHDPYAPYLMAGGAIYAAISLAHGLRMYSQAREDIVTQLHNRWLYETVQQARLREQAQSTEQAATNQKLAAALARAHALATYDDLTGVLNRRAFHARATGELSAQRRHDEAASVVLIDLDHFKTVNDRFGHEVGDEMLRRTASALQNMLRGADILARWGGEEFLIFMPRTRAEVASVVAERLRQTLARLDTSGLPDGVGVTASFGVAEMHTDMTLEAAIARADRGVYAAKAAGHDRVFVAGANQVLLEIPRGELVVEATTPGAAAQASARPTPGAAAAPTAATPNRQVKVTTSTATTSTGAPTARATEPVTRPRRAPNTRP